jgi:hypothetical protein
MQQLWNITLKEYNVGEFLSILQLSNIRKTSMLYTKLSNNLISSSQNFLTLYYITSEIKFASNLLIFSVNNLQYPQSEFEYLQYNTKKKEFQLIVSACRKFIP